MEFREVLRRRRMHRAFLPDPLPEEQVERIAGVIGRAPSGGFSQGGSIVVVTDDDKRAAIAKAFGDEHYSLGGRNYIADAPVHMIISEMKPRLTLLLSVRNGVSFWFRTPAGVR